MGETENFVKPIFRTSRRFYVFCKKGKWPMESTSMKKEDLKNVRFCHEEVIADEVQKKLRMADLKRAQILGNLEKTKVRINFQLEDHSHRMVETTVWAVGTDHLMLKGGVAIPIKAVEEIQLL